MRQKAPAAPGKIRVLDIVSTVVDDLKTVQIVSLLLFKETCILCRIVDEVISQKCKN